MRETETEDERERQRGEKNREGEGRKRDSHKRLKNHRIKKPVSVCDCRYTHSGWNARTRRLCSTASYGRGSGSHPAPQLPSASPQTQGGTGPRSYLPTRNAGWGQVGEVLPPLLVTLRSLPSCVIHRKVFLYEEEEKTRLPVCGEVLA